MSTGTRTITTLAAAAALTAALAGISAPTASAAPVSNFGLCQTLTAFHAEQAPGQSGNGPLTLSASGVVSQPAAFAGWFACSR